MIDITEPQARFIHSIAPYPCMTGGLGSGKSQAGTFRIAMLMLSEPGINSAYYFPTYDLINLRGIPGLTADLERLGAAEYTINKSTYTVTIKGYGDVIFRSYDCPERIVAYEVAHSVVDELDTLPREKAALVWRKVVERNRQKTKHPAGNTVGCVTTPDQGHLGFVYQKWGAPDTQDGYELIKASTYSNPFLPPGYTDSILKNYDADLAKLYLEGEFVTLANRTVCDRRKLTEALTECFKPKKRQAYESGRFVDNDKGELRVWADPKPGERYVIGADVSMGIEGGDYASADVIELSTGYQVAHWHGHIAPDRYADVLYHLGNRYNSALLVVEANNHGLTTLVRLRDYNGSGYSNLYVQTAIDDRGSGEKETRKLGFQTNTRTKPFLIDNLSAHIRDGTHGICNRDTIEELLTFIVTESGSYEAQSGCYDDRVISYALALFGLTQCPGYHKRDPYQALSS